MTFTLPTILAHRGANGLAPENTLSAFRLAVEHGATWLELDVMLSCDEVPMIFHDDRLERITNGHGWVAEHSCTELKALTVQPSVDVGDTLLVGQDTIPSLVELLSFLRSNQCSVNLEIKANQLGVELTCQRVWQALQATGWTRFQLQQRLMVSSFAREAIVFFKEHAPYLARSYLIETYQADALTFASEQGCVGVSFWCEMPDALSFVKEAKAMGMPTLCYTVDSLQEVQQWLNLGIHGLFTNNTACYSVAPKSMVL